MFASVAFGFVSVVLNLLWPDTVFLYMLNAVGAVLLFVWALIAVSQLRLRRVLEREMPERLTLRMWLFPYLTWAALVGMAVVLVLMLFDDSARPQLLWSTGAAAAVLVVAGVRELRARRADAPPRRTRNRPGTGVPGLFRLRAGVITSCEASVRMMDVGCPLIGRSADWTPSRPRTGQGTTPMSQSTLNPSDRQSPPTEPGSSPSATASSSATSR